MGIMATNIFKKINEKQKRKCFIYFFFNLTRNFQFINVEEQQAVVSLMRILSKNSNS